MLLVVIILLGLILLYNIYQQRQVIKNYSGNLHELIHEAGAVKRDLETLMDGAVNLSRQIIEDLDKKIQVATTDQAQRAEIKNNNISLLDSNNYQDTAEIKEQDKQLVADMPQIDAETSYSIEQEQEPDYLAMHPYIAVNTLYKKGLNVKEIAKKLGRGQGEVILILNLCAKKKAI